MNDRSPSPDDARSAPAVLRSAGFSDAPLLDALKRRASLANGEHLEELLARPELLAVEARHIPSAAVAIDGDTILGFITLVDLPHAIQIEDLFVDPVAWRRGVGRQLIGHAERQAIERRVGAIDVVAGESALTFYRSCGFIVVAPTATLFAEAFRLRKTLRTNA